MFLSLMMKKRGFTKTKYCKLFLSSSFLMGSIFAADGKTGQVMRCPKQNYAPDKCEKI